MATQQAPEPTNHTNETLNLSVLRRHNPSISSIISIAAYAVLYTFSPSTSTWEKSGTEGTLFVCRLFNPASPPLPLYTYEQQPYEEVERYAVMILNRRGLDNFYLELKTAEDVDIEGDFIIVSEGEGEGLVAWGLWVYCEEGLSTAGAREVNGRAIKECAVRAEESGKSVDGRRRMGREAAVNGGGNFGMAGWGQGDGMEGVGGHSSGVDSYATFPRAWQRSVDMGLGQQLMGQHGMQVQGPPQRQPDVLEDLFRRARASNM